MSTTSNVSDPKRKWYELALRHLRISLRLSRQGFPDGSFFHSYHAFECAVSAIISSKGYDVPPDGSITTYSGKVPKKYYPSPTGPIYDNSTHKARLVLFNVLADRSKPYFTTFSNLSRFLTVPRRNAALYYDPTLNRLPYQAYNKQFAEGVYKNVRSFAKQVSMEII